MANLASSIARAVVGGIASSVSSLRGGGVWRRPVTKSVSIAAKLPARVEVVAPAAILGDLEAKVDFKSEPVSPPRPEIGFRQNRNPPLQGLLKGSVKDSWISRVLHEFLGGTPG